MTGAGPLLPGVEALGPLGASARIATLDVLRGIALLGILLMNVEGFAGPVSLSGAGVSPGLTGADHLADVLTYLLVQGKFYPLFALLFGAGFALMSARAPSAGVLPGRTGARAFGPLYLRRSAVLLFIGLLHAVLLWSGDILVMYALVSVLLLAFRQLPARALAVLGVLACLAMPVFLLGMGALGSMLGTQPDSATLWNDAIAASQADSLATAAAERAGAAGTYAASVVQRWHDLGRSLAELPYAAPPVLGLFCLGAWAMRSGALVRPAAWPRLHAAARWIALPVGLLLSIAAWRLSPWAPGAALDLRYGLSQACYMLGGVLLCLGYVAWIVRGLSRPASARGLAVFAPAGRMALTNYLLQSVIGTLVFYGYGLHLQLSRAALVPFAVGVFALQVLLSRMWLARFEFGPMEWAWRALTYGTRPPLRRVRGEAVALPFRLTPSSVPPLPDAPQRPVP